MITHCGLLNYFFLSATKYLHCSNLISSLWLLGLNVAGVLIGTASATSVTLSPEFDMLLLPLICVGQTYYWGYIDIDVDRCVNVNKQHLHHELYQTNKCPYGSFIGECLLVCTTEDASTTPGFLLLSR